VITARGAEPGVWPLELEELYREERLRLLRVAYLICGDRSACDDLVQDAVARVAQRWDDVDDGRAYLRAAVANGARDELRRAGRRRTTSWELGMDPAGDPADAQVVDLARALRTLSHDHRTVVVLRYFGAWTDQEMADALDVQPATIRSWLHRARTQLRKELSIPDE
jgi:RNA polymerase sigma factor (sigma-70 family)